MDWILIGIVAGSLVTGTFKDKEACMGRVATLHEQNIEAKCVEAPFRSSITIGTTPICTNYCSGGSGGLVCCN